MAERRLDLCLVSRCVLCSDAGMCTSRNTSVALGKQKNQVVSRAPCWPSGSLEWGEPGLSPATGSPSLMCMCTRVDRVCFPSLSLRWRALSQQADQTMECVHLAIFFKNQGPKVHF